MVRIEIVDGEVTRPLRRLVLRPEQTIDQPIPGDGLDDAVHVAVIADDGNVLGACFLLPETCEWRPEDQPAWRLRGMASEPTLRSRGIGRMLVSGSTDYVASQGGVLLWCHARVSAEPFYLRTGWQPYGDTFLEHNLPHRNMWLAI